MDDVGSAAPMHEKRSPVTGALLGRFPISQPEDVKAAVTRARDAFGGWRDTPVGDRLRLLARIRDVIRVHGEEYARRISDDTGKPLVDALMTELMLIPIFLDYYKRTAPRLLARQKVPTPTLFGGKTSFVERFPMGVVAVIARWNFPLNLSVLPTLSALIAGNTVVLKPSEETPITGEIVEEIFRRIGLHRGVVEVVPGDGSTGEALCRADVDKVFFTGSVATGRKVMAAAAEKPIPVDLELGGKDAMIVLADAHLERAARAAAWGGLLNSGQMCTSVERIFVERTVYDPFVALLERAVDAVRVGAPQDHADIGPLIRAAQQNKVAHQVDDAVRKGARIRRGGAPLKRAGHFFAPTLVTDVKPGMALYDEETFGPVLSVIRIKDAEQAVQMTNDHSCGLAASVWTSDRSLGMEIASRLTCGQVMVNDVVSIQGNPALPFGGVRKSGFGRYHGPEGLLAFTHQKAVMVDRGRRRSEPLWFPYEGKYRLVSTLFRALVGGNVPRALVTLSRLGRLSRRRNTPRISTTSHAAKAREG